MGRLENRASRMVYHKLIGRIQTFRNHPRYGFMFENANLGGDIMADVVGGLFRLPTEGKPMTIMGLAGFPSEVVDAVVSVLSRMAFDFGVWSDGIAPLLFVCEEAHRYAPADRNSGWSYPPSLSRIAKEGRKYGVYLGLVTQRPGEINFTILSQCSTLFVMRLSNESDQALVRAAVSKPPPIYSHSSPLSVHEKSLLSAPALPCPPACGSRNCLLSCDRILTPLAIPTRKFALISAASSVKLVIGRWRSATMGYRISEDDMQEAALSLDGAVLATLSRSGTTSANGATKNTCTTRRPPIEHPEDAFLIRLQKPSRCPRRSPLGCFSEGDRERNEVPDGRVRHGTGARPCGLGTSARMRPIRFTASSKWPPKKCAAANPSIGK